MSQILTDVQPDDPLAHRIKDAAVIAGLSRSTSLAIRYEPIVALRLDPQNPRLHSRKQVRQIANSIKSFGFNVPVLMQSRALSRATAGFWRRRSSDGPRSR